MKKWLIILSMIFGTSAVTAATFGGYAVLNTKEIVYEDNQMQDLNVQAMKNIYINSSVPVEVFSTTGQPRAEFVQKSSNFIKNFPKYELMITENEGNTYIDLNQIEVLNLFNNSRNDSYLTVYLPESTIERLTIESKGSTNQSSRMHTIDLKNINVNDLNIQLNQGGMINLDGNYNHVSLNVGTWKQKTFNMKSKTPATVRIVGNVTTYLEGQFEKINIEHCNEDITIHSETPCQVGIKNCDNSEIDLRGQYTRISVDGYEQRMNLDSDIECKLDILGGNNVLYAKGPFKMINLGGYDSKIEVQTTIVPRNIQLGEKMNSQVKLILPSNIPGFEVNGTLPYDVIIDETSMEVADPYSSNLLKSSIKSDFDATTQIYNEQFSIQYGNNTTKINIDTTLNEEFQLELIDGGYAVAL